MRPSQGADKNGPLAGVPYDGKLTKADGKGQWWEGLDPQELYAQNHAPMGLEWDWNNGGRGDLPSPAYMRKVLQPHHGTDRQVPSGSGLL